MRYAVVTHQKGSWKWQDRYALVEYRMGCMKDGTLVWKSHRVVNDKVTPGWAKVLQSSGYRGLPVTQGSLHYARIPVGIVTACGGAV